MIAQYTLELRNGLPSLVTEKIHYISEKGYINSETVIQLLNDTLRLNRKAEEHVVMLAFQEVEKMRQHPERVKSYQSFGELLQEVQKQNERKKHL